MYIGKTPNIKKLKVQVKTREPLPLPTNGVMATTWAYLPESVELFVNGVKLSPGADNDYQEVTDTTISTVYPILLGDIVEVVYLRK